MIPWQSIVLNLKREGLSYQHIAIKTGSAPETIGHLARGEVNEPRWRLGYELLTLHARHCPADHRREVYDNA